MVIEFPTTEMIDLDKTIHALQKAKESGFVMFSPVMVTGDFTGFIPCPSCADKVLKGQLKLKDLIINRKCKKEFPKDDMDT